MRPVSDPVACSNKQHAGFSIVELMLAIAIGLLILAGVGSVFLSNKQGYRSSEALSQMQESTRTALGLLERSIRGAGGTVCGNGVKVANVLNGTDLSLTWMSQSLQGFDGDQSLPGVVAGTAVAQRVSGTDAIRLQSVSDTAYTVESHGNGNNNSAAIKLNQSGAGIAEGDILMICDADHAAIFQASQVNQQGIVVNTGKSTTPGNCSKGLGYPTECTPNGTDYPFKPNSVLARLSSVAWYIGNNGRAGEGGRSLFRLESGVAVEVVAGVTDLQLRYRVAQAADWQAAKEVSNWSKVDTVELVLTVASGERNVAVAGSQADGRLVRQASLLVSLRNRTL